VGDTVVLFSLRDFLRNKKWSKDAVEQGLRRRRGRRGVGRSVANTTSNATSTTANGEMGKRELGLAFAQRRAERGRRVLARLYSSASAAAVGAVAGTVEE
jgi:hypothetical protein